MVIIPVLLMRKLKHRGIGNLSSVTELMVVLDSDLDCLTPEPKH